MGGVFLSYAIPFSMMSWMSNFLFDFFPGHGPSTQIGTEASSQCAPAHYAWDIGGEDYEPPTLQNLSGKHCYQCR